MVTSVGVDNSPSLAVARSTYRPGRAKSTLVTAWPSVTRRGPASSKRTLAGPPYSNHVTFKPRRGRVEVLFCPLGGSAVTFFLGTGGFGSPSSTTIALSVTGLPTVATGTGATEIDGGWFGSPTPGLKFPRVWINRSRISSEG